MSTFREFKIQCKKQTCEGNIVQYSVLDVIKGDEIPMLGAHTGQVFNSLLRGSGSFHTDDDDGDIISWGH